MLRLKQKPASEAKVMILMLRIRKCLCCPSKRGCSCVWRNCSKRRHKVRVSIPKANPISAVTIRHHADTDLRALIRRLLVRKLPIVSRQQKRERKRGAPHQR